MPGSHRLLGRLANLSDLDQDARLVGLLRVEPSAQARLSGSRL